VSLGVWKVADVRAAEARAMARLPEGALMRRAAGALAVRCARLLDAVYGARVLLLVGSGDNGGDTLYAGAGLARRGARVDALLLNPSRVHAGGLAAFRAAGGSTVDRPPSTVDMMLDGIVGIGGTGGLRPDAAAAYRTAREAARTVVAVDVPSGVDADTGAVEGEAVRADVTVTFGCLKPGLVVGEGAAYAGYVDLVDIGLMLPGTPAVRVPTHADVSAWWPRPWHGSDKYTRGVVGISAGSARYPGAAVLSVSGALAGPSGLVRYAGSAVQSIWIHHPTVVASEYVAEAGRVQAWLCGSGLGTDERARDEVRAVLASPVPVCLDADALTLVANGAVRLTHRDAATVVTPHDREFARLYGRPPGPDRIASALDLARRMGVTVLLKGDRTVVATPEGTVWVNPTGTAALATGGTGDVLGGLLGSLLAAGLPADRAAVAAAYAHGLAGRYAAGSGPVTASDVAGALRPVLADISPT
jgi:ADP-dependent NAD(P)H-hydrate dehydratase / NAD(P)H-hydrate epimerase